MNQPPHNGPQGDGHFVSAGNALVHRTEQLPSTQFYQEPQYGPAPDDDTIDLRHYWEIIVKRKWTVVTFLLIVVVAVMTATFLMTRIYRASLTLQIDQQEAKVVEIQGVTPNEMPASSKDFYQTQYEILESRSLAKRVIDQLNLGDHPAFNRKDNGLMSFFSSEEEPEQGDREARLVTNFLKQLTIEPVRNSRLVKIHFDSPDPQLSARVANAISQAFINLNLERRMDASSYAKTFLQERLQQIKVKLEESEKSLNEFARAEEIIRADEKQTGPDAQVLQEFTTALARAQQERIKAETLYSQYKSNDAGLAAILENRVIQEYKARKAKLETDYQEGLKIYKPAYPKMLQIESQIAEMQAKIDEEINNVRGAVKAQYDAALAQEQLISKKLEEAKRNVLSYQDRSIQYNILRREVDTNRQLYDGLLQRLKEVGVAGGIGVNNISIVDRAEVPILPHKPNLKLNFLVALVLGLFGGVGLALLFEHLDDSIKLPDDLEKLLGLPVLGIVPAVKSGDEDDMVLTENADPRSAFAESYRSVRTALQFSTPDGAPKVLMITSASMGEGKSTTAISLAIHFSQMGKTVLLIDADLRKASLHKKMGIANDNGLTNYLAGDSKPVEITKACRVPKVFVVPSGPLPPNPAELISSAKMASFLKLAAEKFDQVIIDGPPVLGLADAPLLGSLSEATVLVVEAGATSRGHAQNAAKRLRTTRSRLLGGILTKLDTRAGGAYGYYHNYYYNDLPDRGRMPA